MGLWVVRSVWVDGWRWVLASIFYGAFIGGRKGSNALGNAGEVGGCVLCSG